MQKQAWSIGQVACSLLGKCRFPKDRRRQVWKKEQAQNQVTQGLECQARSFNLILQGQPVKVSNRSEYHQKAALAAMWRTD